MESLEDLRLNANDMPIMIEKEFKSANLVMHPKLPGLVSDTMKTYNNAKSKTLEKNDIPKIFKAVFIKEKRSLKDKKFSNFIQIN